MASRIIHLAITNMLIKQFDFRDTARLRIGTIIPDASCNRQEYLKSHFKTQIGDKDERTYDLTDFRNRFRKLMKEDDLYLGYYLHLIQDLLYRHFVYDKYHWDPRPEGNVERLHEDYRQINEYVINKYKIDNDICIPADFANETMTEIATFDVKSFVAELQRDFEGVEAKERFFFTDSMVDEYINWAVDYCMKELEALKCGTFYFNEYEWSWGK